ncbi:MAG: fatty acid desaturase [Ignavibacteriales bacterium]|nr:fatty acid desaturase [Ignavibacteriales bacterium]
MTSVKIDFQFSTAPEPHKERTRAILKTHPEVREHIGRNPYSFLIILFAIGLQLTIAYLLSSQQWWLALLAAFFIGAFANHACYVLIHEAAHNLIFKNRAMNYISGILADIPNVLPSSVSFRSYHLKHHSFQGDYYLDADLASKWEAKIIGHSFFGKALWEILFPVFQAVRTPRLKEIQFMNAWTIVNWIVVFGVDALVIIFFGWTSFFYLVFSFFFSIGFHPLGARWIQEHFLIAPPQETYSYYGPLNIVALNVGYHNEHHDFPSIPWSNLPKVKAAAPEFYDNLVYHKSWTMLWLKFLFDPKLSLYSRMTRDNRGGLTID